MKLLRAPCAARLDLAVPIIAIGAPSTTPSFVRSLPIPNQASLAGGKITLQTLWLNSDTLFPVKGGNGAQITVGR